MKIDELKCKLINLEVNPSWYSLNGELEVDRLVLFRIYSVWQVLYVDDRGNQEEIAVFGTEEEAGQFLYDTLFEHLKRWKMRPENRP